MDKPGSGAERRSDDAVPIEQYDQSCESELVETIDVALPRPRLLSLKRTPEFVLYVDRIWRLIEDDVRSSVIEERV